MLRNLDIAILRTFVEVAHAGSFTKATEKVFRTQSSVSLQVKRLEQEMGKALFFRDGRGVRLTSYGEVLLEAALKILRINDEIQMSFSERIEKSTISIGVYIEFTLTKLSACFARLKLIHPELSLRINADTAIGLKEGLEKSEYDIIFSQCEEADCLSAVMSWQQSLLWVGARNNPISTSGTIPLILPPEGSLIRNRVIKALHDRNMDAQIVMQTPTILGIQTAVEAGLGISAINRNSIPPFLRVLPSPDPMPLLPNLFFALFHRTGTLDPATLTVIRSIRHYLDTNLSN